jgi:glycosyltransferase involved in cell wall biosynthesis
LASVKDYVADLEIPNVEFLGFVTGEKKKEAFERADIFVLPTSHGEGMPISLLEAMAFGLPIITRPVGGISDFFVNGRHGFISDSLSAEDFAELVSRLITDVDLYNLIRSYNYYFAREYFTGSKVASRIQAVYCELLDGGARIKDWYH